MIGSPPTHRIAIVGGGISGSMVAHTLAEACKTLTKNGKESIKVDLFDQGRSGVGGRTSHRIVSSKEEIPEPTLRWDHGCQFFRADTSVFQSVVHGWLEQGIVEEWKGPFLGNQHTEYDFFGFPSKPPFYVSVGGMKTITQSLVDSPFIQVYSGTRVAKLVRNEDEKTWSLFGTSGDAAFHDTPEEKANSAD